MMNRKRFQLIALLTLLSIPAFAELPGFEGIALKTLSFDSIVHSQYPKNEVYDYWERLIIDFPSGRALQTLYPGKEKPVTYADPEILTLVDGDLMTKIDHKKKRVTLSAANQPNLESLAPLYGGRFFHGRDIAGIIQHASSAGIIDATDSNFVFQVGKPYFNPPQYQTPFKFLLDSHYRVIQITNRSSQGPFMSTQMKWSQKEPENFEYVSYLKFEVRTPKFFIRSEHSVQEVQINPTLPAGVFEITHPGEYKVYDMRKLLQSPSLGVFGGITEPSGTSQTP